jgi:hypothetical protein
MSEFLLPLLQCLYDGLDGEATFACDSVDTFRSGDRVEIQSFLNSHPGEEIILGLATSAGIANYRAQHLVNESEIEACFDDYGDPALALQHMEKKQAIFLYPRDMVTEDCQYTVDAIPVPGTGGWELTKLTIEKIMPAVVEETVPWAEPEAVATPAAEPVEAFTFKDAEFIHGDVPQAVMDLPLVLSTGRSRKDMRWVPRAMTFQNLLGLLVEHKEGTKDGNSFLQGSCIDNQRKANAIDALYVVGLDVDCGIDIDWVIDRVQNYLNGGRGLTSVIYTTHSHMTTSTTVLESSFTQFAKKNKVAATPTKETMALFLTKDRHWTKAIADTVELVEIDGEERSQTSDGFGFTLSHAPIPKFRIVFPLAIPFVVAKQKGLSQADVINLWKGRLLGLSKIIDLPIDESCLDPSRLFYMPRHDKGRPFRIVVTSGDPLDFDAIPNVQPRKREALSEDVFAAAAAELGAKAGSTLVVDGFNLKQWAGKTAATFDITKLIREVAPTRVRHDDNSEKIELECPFDFTHSNAGDPEDRAGWVQSARAELSERGFSWGCQHNSCKQRDRLEFVAQAMENGWITKENLTDDAFRVFTIDEQKDDPDKIVEDILATMVMWTPETPRLHTLINDMLTSIIKQGIPHFLVETICDKLKSSKLTTASKIKETLKIARRMVANSEGEDAKIARLMKNSTMIGFPAKYNKLILTAENGYARQRQRVRDILDEINSVSVDNEHEKNILATRLFDFGNMRYSVERQYPKADVATEKATKEHLSNLLCGENGLFFFAVTDDGLRSEAISNRILSEMLVDQGWHCPELAGFSELPYFNKKAELVRASGYNAVSKMYLKPSKLAAELNVPEKPTKEQVEEARRILLDVLYGDFPFDDGPDNANSKGAGSRAHFMAMLLQPFIRNMIQGPTPIYLVSKPTPGTGGTILVQTALYITSGKEASGATAPAQEEEQRKLITTAFVKAKTYFWLDNIHGEIRSQAYCNLATGAVWEDRILGATEMAVYPNQMQFIIVGNNPRGTREIMRRCLPIRLDAHMDPNKRDKADFQIQEPIDWVKDNHKELAEAVLTIIQSWVVGDEGKDNGCKPFSGEPLMSFESWSKITGGILEHAKIPGFLTNLHLTQKFADEETAGFQQLIQLWMSRVKMGESMTAAQIAGWYEAGAEPFPTIGVRYNDNAAMMTPHFTRVLNEKQGSPFDEIVDKDGRTVTVKIMKRRDPKTKIDGFYLETM